ncbi:MAG: hypothetical protein ICV87_11310, partial [Gemmatimonadetes bacterium]|nr:hypothetical protein [Gemmatimonadota bacterium]
MLKRIPLPEPVSGAATLAADSAGRVWVGDAGRLTVLDTLGRVAARIPVPGAPARILLMHGGQLYVTRGPRDFAVLDAATGRIRAARRARRTAPFVVDPSARWAFTVGRWGGVLG